jgi:pfkB family carbohydrate kinase
VIVVVGSPSARASAGMPAVAAGLAANIAVVAARAGAAVQIVGRVGDDSLGEAVLLDLAARGVGHVAVLRDAGRPTRMETADEPGENAPDVGDDEAGEVGGAASAGLDQPTVDAADLELALSYLPDYSVLVVAERITREARAVVGAAAGWNSSSVVVVGGAEELAGLPDDVTAFAPPDGDPDGAFAAMVGTYAAGLDRGEDPRAAFKVASGAVGSNPVN